MVRAVLIASLLVVAGCAHRAPVGGPIVDMRGVDPALYRMDLAECGEYANQVAVGQKVVRGAVAGAVVGGAIGAAVGNHETAERAAGAGAVAGAAKGAGYGIYERRQVVKNCLRHRGYAVLN